MTALKKWTLFKRYFKQQNTKRRRSETEKIFLVSPSGYFKSMKSKAQDQNNRKEEEIGKAFELHKGRYGYRKLSHYLNRSGGVLYSPAQVRHALKERGLKARKARLCLPNLLGTNSGRSKAVSFSTNRF